MRFEYTGFHGSPGTCEIKIVHALGLAFVICSEIPDNPGRSVTNMAEAIATAVCKEYDLNPNRMVWIEHYPPSHGRTKDSYDLVTFKQKPSPGFRDLGTAGVEFCYPDWKPLDLTTTLAELLDLGHPASFTKEENTE